MGTEAIDPKVMETTGHFLVLVVQGKGDAQGEECEVLHSIK